MLTFALIYPTEKGVSNIGLCLESLKQANLVPLYTKN